MKLKAVIFDLDGTILDTLGDLTNSVNFALRQNGLPSRSLEEVKSFVGNGIRLLIERSVPEGTDEETVNKCFDTFKTHYKDNSNILTKPYDGICKLLNTILSKGLKTAVVSNKADFAVQSLVEEHFKGFFICSVGEREGIRRKPSPDSVLSVMETLCVNKDECVYIGDSEVDVETAKNAGIKCICVTWGFRGRALLQSLSPDYIVDTTDEIIKIIGE